MKPAERRRKSRRVSADRRLTSGGESMLAVVVQQWGEPSVLEVVACFPEPEVLITEEGSGPAVTEAWPWSSARGA